MTDLALGMACIWGAVLVALSIAYSASRWRDR